MTKYKLLGLDVDGTLVGSDDVVDRGVRQAIAHARSAGLAVCLATGRSYIEGRDVWRQLRLEGPLEPMVTVGGAVVCESDTGRTLYHRSIPRDAAGRFGAALNGHGFVAMALVDGWRHEVDYVVTDAGDQHAASRDWFAKMNVSVVRTPSLAEAPADMPILRISAVVSDEAAGDLAAELTKEFGDEIGVHAILAPNYGVTIVEAHARGADKMTALRYVGQPMLVGAGAMVAVGDDINDLTMVRDAGLGAAMAHAPDVLKDAADVVIPSDKDGRRAGLTDFINRLVAGEFD